MIANGNVEIDEQESGTYVMPVGKPYTWVLYVFKDGTADLYKKRNPETGAVLGKPIRVQDRPATA